MYHSMARQQSAAQIPLPVGTGATSLGGTLGVADVASFGSTVSVATLGSNTGAVGLCRNSPIRSQAVEQIRQRHVATSI